MKGGPLRPLAVSLALATLVALPVAAQEGAVYRVPVTGTIEMGIAPFIKRVIREAEAAEARAVILDVNTLGGRVDAALEIIDAVSAAQMPVYAFVHPRAISAGALIAISTDSVFMTPDATMGASTVVDAAGSKVSEKAQSVMRAQFRALAERRGLDPRVGEAMVDENIMVEGLTEKGQLLTLTAAEAERVGYAVPVAGFDEVLSRLGLGGASVVTPRTNWAEALVRFLTNPLVAPLLLSIGVLGVMIEIKTPSFGLAGTVGLASLAAFFGSHLIIGLAGWEELLLLGAGLVALGIEVFVVPGFGIAGVVSIVCVTAAIFLALIGNIPTWTDFARASAVLGVTVGLVTAAIYAIVRHLPTSARWRGVFLQDATSRDAGYVSADAREELVGEEGVALTDLHPSGTARVGEERLDVVSDAGFIPKGTAIRIVRAEGYRLVVLPADV
jgi:membrane-bound serine protease (ClpP class)